MRPSLVHGEREALVLIAALPHTCAWRRRGRRRYTAWITVAFALGARVACLPLAPGMGALVDLGGGLGHPRGRGRGQDDGKHRGLVHRLADARGRTFGVAGGRHGQQRAVQVAGARAGDLQALGYRRRGVLRRLGARAPLAGLPDSERGPRRTSRHAKKGRALFRGLGRIQVLLQPVRGAIPVPDDAELLWGRQTTVGHHQFRGFGRFAPTRRHPPILVLIARLACRRARHLEGLLRIPLLRLHPRLFDRARPWRHVGLGPLASEDGRGEDGSRWARRRRAGRLTEGLGHVGLRRQVEGGPRAASRREAAQRAAVLDIHPEIPRQRT
mmetsp:Transcript_58008/g.168157  ORF Transcript_58008/g.168157 Transcript_58008/m.168157 type:complete len:327 (+) Transcript_58008:616-1596(+)